MKPGMIKIFNKVSTQPSRPGYIIRLSEYQSILGLNNELEFIWTCLFHKRVIELRKIEFKHLPLPKTKKLKLANGTLNMEQWKIESCNVSQFHFASAHCIGKSSIQISLM